VIRPKSHGISAEFCPRHRRSTAAFRLPRKSPLRSWIPKFRKTRTGLKPSVGINAGYSSGAEGNWHPQIANRLAALKRGIGAILKRKGKNYAMKTLLRSGRTLHRLHGHRRTSEGKPTPWAKFRLTTDLQSHEAIMFGIASANYRPSAAEELIQYEAKKKYPTSTYFKASLSPLRWPLTGQSSGM